MLELRETSYSRGPRTIVDGVDLAFAAGTITVLLGPHGAGKTSLLRLLAGEIAPTAGCVLLDGRRIDARPRFADTGCASGGWNLRRVVARDTEYVLLDEPEGSGAAKHRDGIPSLFHRLVTSGATVIAAMHELDQALFFADRIILMHRGQVVTDGLPEIVLEAGLLRRVYSLPCVIAGAY